MFTEQQIQEEIDFVLKIITHPAGYDLDLFGSMCVRPTDQGIWCVSWEQDHPMDDSSSDPYFCMIQSRYGDQVIYEIEKSFPTPEKAAEFFVRKRYQKNMGLDFETMYSEKV